MTSADDPKPEGDQPTPPEEVSTEPEFGNGTIVPQEAPPPEEI